MFVHPEVNTHRVGTDDYNKERVRYTFFHLKKARALFAQTWSRTVMQFDPSTRLVYEKIDSFPLRFMKIGKPLSYLETNYTFLELYMIAS